MKKRSVQSGPGPLGQLLLLLLLVASLALGPGTLTSQAQDPDSSSAPDSSPPRLLERAAPKREPRVIEQTMTSEGLTNSIIELPAIADAYIASEWPHQNFGDGALYLGYNLNNEDNFGAERILVRFDVENNIPQGAVINEAQLRLRLNFSLPVEDDPMPTVLRRLGSTWSEDDLTWNREPAWEDIRAETEVGSDLRWYEWDVTSLVDDWGSGNYPNYGMEIIGDERVQQRERAFYSRETTTEFYPRLEIDYTDFNDTEPPKVSVNPLPDCVDRDFTVSWSGTDPGGSGIASYDVQYRANHGDWKDWLIDVTISAADFTGGHDGVFYEFRARGEDRAGNVESFGAPEASTTVDAAPPTSHVNPLPAITNEATFEVTWDGEDEGCGIQYYDVRYRFNRLNWTPWQQETVSTSATFTAMRDGLYDFEVRAVDNFGLKEEFTGQPEASILVDSEPPFLEPALWLPFVAKY